jgi:hypothetical protein
LIHFSIVKCGDNVNPFFILQERTAGESGDGNRLKTGGGCVMMEKRRERAGK